MPVSRLLTELDADPNEFAQWKALYTVERRERAEHWSRLEQLAAAQIEAIDLWGRILALGQGWKAQQLPNPVDISRPGRETPKSNDIVTDARAIRAFFS